MALIVTAAPPATLLSTLDRVKAELGITSTDNDDVLADLLADASDAIAHECGRPHFGVGSYVETLRGTGSQLLAVTNTPILQVTSIYQDTDLLSPIDPTNPNDPNLDDGYYIEDAEAGALYRPSGWGQTVALLSWGWEAYSSRYILPGGTNALRYLVTYTAGYFLPCQEQYALAEPATGNDPLYDVTAGSNPSGLADAPPLPGGLERACLATVKAWWFARARDVAINAVRTRNQQVTYDPAATAKALPAYALGLLRDYRRVVA